MKIREIAPLVTAILGSDAEFWDFAIVWLSLLECVDDFSSFTEADIFETVCDQWSFYCVEKNRKTRRRD